MVKIIFLDDRGRTVSAGTYGVHSGTNWNDAPQPFVHNIMPDQAGNYIITTSVSSVMFDYGTYTVQATSYQGGKIVNTSEPKLLFGQSGHEFEIAATCKRARKGLFDAT